MSGYIIHNGEIMAAGAAALSYSNRSFRYGDGYFETIRMEQSVVLWASQHYERIQRSADMLQMRLHPLLDEQRFHDMLQSLYRHNHADGKPARIRMSFYRNGGGLYTPDHNDSGFLIESSDLQHSLYPLNAEGLLTDIYPGPPRHPSALSRIKTASAISFVLAAIYRQQQGLGDCFILNTEGGIAEACSSNVFMVKDACLYTPGLDQGGIAGVMRAVIIDIAKKAGYDTIETCIHPETLEEGDELFLTNAIAGIRWVAGFRQKCYNCLHSRKLSVLLNKHAGKLLQAQAT